MQQPARVLDPQDCEPRCRALGKCPIRLPLEVSRGEGFTMACGFVVPPITPQVGIAEPVRVPFAPEPQAPWPDLFECKTCGMWVMPDERHPADECAAFKSENSTYRRTA